LKGALGDIETLKKKHDEEHDNKDKLLEGHV